MNTLFDIDPILPKGFSYYPSFISEDEEVSLLNLTQEYDLQAMKFHQYVAKRNVKSFGRGWSFTEQKLIQGNPIPQEFDFLINKISNQLQIKKELIAQFLITEYPVGSVINWHRDAPPFDIIIGVSLLTDCILKLRPYQPEKQSRSATISLNVQCRSLYVMKGESKTEWQHCTVPANNIRYSLTFRTLKPEKNIVI